MDLLVNVTEWKGSGATISDDDIRRGTSKTQLSADSRWILWALLLLKEEGTISWTYDAFVGQIESQRAAARAAHSSPGGVDVGDLKERIRSDVKRTAPDDAYFHTEEMEALLERVMIEQALRYPSTGYQQGMTDLLVPLLRLRVATSSSVTLDGHQIVFDPQHVEVDVTWMVARIIALSGCWERGSGQQDRVSAACALVDLQILPAIDPAVAAKLRKHDIVPQLYCLRWYRLLFCREFGPDEVLTLWDSLLTNFELLPYMCALMMACKRVAILEADETTIFSAINQDFAGFPAGGIQEFIDRSRAQLSHSERRAHPARFDPFLMLATRSLRVNVLQRNSSGAYRLHIQAAAVPAVRMAKVGDEFVAFQRHLTELFPSLVVPWLAMPDSHLLKVTEQRRGEAQRLAIERFCLRLCGIRQPRVAELVQTFLGSEFAVVSASTSNKRKSPYPTETMPAKIQAIMQEEESVAEEHRREWKRMRRSVALLYSHQRLYGQVADAFGAMISQPPLPDEVEMFQVVWRPSALDKLATVCASTFTELESTHGRYAADVEIDAALFLSDVSTSMESAYNVLDHVAMKRQVLQRCQVTEQSARDALERQVARAPSLLAPEASPGANHRRVSVDEGHYSDTNEDDEDYVKPTSVDTTSPPHLQEYELQVERSVHRVVEAKVEAERVDSEALRSLTVWQQERREDRYDHLMRFIDGQIDGHRAIRDTWQQCLERLQRI